MFEIEIISSDGRKSSQQVDSRSYAWSALNVDTLTIRYIGKGSYSFLPFSISVEYKSSSMNYLGLFISLGVVVFICTMCSIFFYKCSKALIAKRRQRNQNLSHFPNNNVIQINQVMSEEQIKKQNLERIQALLETTLKPKKYKENLNVYKGNCSICLEEFKLESDVTDLPCKHIFHFECLRGYLHKNILQSKCPNCNYFILNQDHHQILNVNGQQIRSNMNLSPEVRHALGHSHISVINLQGNVIPFEIRNSHGVAIVPSQNNFLVVNPVHINNRSNNTNTNEVVNINQNH
jgi:hypothetical protein